MAVKGQCRNCEPRGGEAGLYKGQNPPPPAAGRGFLYKLIYKAGQVSRSIGERRRGKGSGFFMYETGGRGLN